MFDQGTRDFSGVAGRGMDDADPGAWMGISRWWTDYYYDADRQPVGDNRTLQHALGHEADHISGYNHLPGSVTETPHSRQCSDVP